MDADLVVAISKPYVRGKVSVFPDVPLSSLTPTKHV